MKNRSHAGRRAVLKRDHRDKRLKFRAQRRAFSFAVAMRPIAHVADEKGRALQTVAGSRALLTILDDVSAGDSNKDSVAASEYHALTRTGSGRGCTSMPG